MNKQKITDIVLRAIKKCQKEGIFPVFVIPEIVVEKSHDGRYGDYAVNVALRLAKDVKQSPLDIAKKIKVAIEELGSDYFSKIEIAGPGFINFYLANNYYYKEIKNILRQKDNYGQLKDGKGKKVQVEFISANPTGPLTMGNARGGFFGDALANILNKAGYKAERAYYINDYGMQVMTLGHSVLKDGEAKYKGDYIEKLNKKNKLKDPYKVGEWAAKTIVNTIIKKTVKRMGITYDDWMSETALHKSGAVDKAINALKKKGLIFEQEGALWFKATRFGDQRDRVIVKGNNWKTYLAGDIALHQYKFIDKKFAKVINIWGADHYGDVPGLMGVVDALGHKGKLEIILMQFVTLMKNGVSFKMSKRLGTYVTVDQFLDMTGNDSARFFILQRSSDTHINFDLDLAKEQSDKNPVFYVQYAHARMESILRKVKSQITKHKAKSQNIKPNLKLLIHPSEMALIKQLLKFPEVVSEMAKDYQLQRLPQYSFELASAFHQFYRDCRVISDNQKLTAARIALLSAAKIVLKNTLLVMGISVPKKM